MALEQSLVALKLVVLGKGGAILGAVLVMLGQRPVAHAVGGIIEDEFAKDVATPRLASSIVPEPVRPPI